MAAGQSLRPAAREDGSRRRCSRSCEAGEASVVIAGRRPGRGGRSGSIRRRRRLSLRARRVNDPADDRSAAAAPERGSPTINALVDRARALQLRFNAALLLVSLLIVAALDLDRAAARRPAGSAGRRAGRRGPAGHRRRPLGAGAGARATATSSATLGNAFNRMTGRLEEQTGALVSANAQLDSRRAFIEAVLSGVTAGIISVDQERNVRLINSSAEALLKTDKDQRRRPQARRARARARRAISTATSARTSSSSPPAASRARWR